MGIKFKQALPAAQGTGIISQGEPALRQVAADIIPQLGIIIQQGSEKAGGGGEILFLVSALSLLVTLGLGQTWG